MAKQTGTFIDDARLHARDNSGGPMGPNTGGDFGGGGKVIGGEADESRDTPMQRATEDEFMAPPPAPQGGTKRGKRGY
jgi:hypothetical protein